MPGRSFNNFTNVQQFRVFLSSGAAFSCFAEVLFETPLLVPPHQSFGNLQPLICDLVNYFIRQGGVKFGSQMYANKDCDRITYDLKLEGGGRDGSRPVVLLGSWSFLLSWIP